MPMETISYSEIKLARKCWKAWHYRYREYLRRKKPKRPTFIGILLHEMLDALAKLRMDPNETWTPWTVLERYEKEYAKLWKEEQEEFGDIPALAQAIFEGYMRRWRGDGLRYLGSELEVKTELTKGIWLKARLDKVVVDQQKRRFLMDHKFHRIIPGPEDRFADIQTVLYFWAYNSESPRSEKLDGLIWDYGRVKAPAIPEVLKRGGLSKRANIDTDVHTYRETLRENGIPEKGYRDILKKLEGKERTFFERVILPSPPKVMVESIVEDARATALARKHIGKAPARSMSGFNCKTCDFRTVCEAEVRGLDAKFVRKRDYIIQEPKEETDGEETIEEAA